MTVKVRVEGLRQVKEALHDLPSRATKKNVLRRVGMEAMEPIARDARARVHVDQGHLKESIGVSTRLSKSQRHTKKHRDEVEIYAGPGPDPAAHLEEFGSVHNVPHPFMRPAWDGGKMRLLRELENRLWAEVQKAAARAARKAARLARKAGGR